VIKKNTLLIKLGNVFFLGYNRLMFDQMLYQLKRPYHFFKTGLLRGLTSQIKYKFPEKKLKIICITGTDGKTTTSTLTYHLLKTAGKKVGLISTVAAYIGDEQIDTGLHVTAPGPMKLRAFMQKMVTANCEYLVLEMTSHGAYQFRDWGIKPLIAGVTNITHEHLDYHLNYENYVEAKALILQKAQTVFLNQDDQSFYRLKQKMDLKKQQVRSYSLEHELDKKLEKAIQEKFPEKYNQANAHLAVSIAEDIDIEIKKLVKGISSFKGVPGRMEEIKNNKKLKIIIDFAHTPNALYQALTSLRQQLKQQKNSGKLIAVYGCAGLRDQSKRPMMGKIGVQLADLVVFTAEDPRTEDVWSIIRQMKEQLETGHNKIVSIADREQAIEFALTKLAKPGDTIGILGKGPEKSMCYGTIEIPWSDKEAVKKILKKI